MRNIALVLVLLGVFVVCTGCPENPPAPPTKPAGGDASAPVGSK